MKLRKAAVIGASIIGATLIFLFLTLCFVPNHDLEALTARILRQEGYVLRCTTFGKAFPLGIKVTGLEISNDRGPLLTAREFVIRLKFLPLLTGNVAFSGKAAIGTGRLFADYSRRTGDIRIEGSGIHLEDLPFFHTMTDATVKGIARIDGHFQQKGKNSGGEVKIDVKGANVAGIKIGGIPLPDADYPSAQVAVRTGSGVISLVSFTLEGAGIYARLKGDIPVSQPLGTSPLNLVLEMMPKPDFMENQKFVFLLLAKYMISPGHYQIPIRGILSRPALS